MRKSQGIIALASSFCLYLLGGPYAASMLGC